MWCALQHCLYQLYGTQFRNSDWQVELVRFFVSGAEMRAGDVQAARQESPGGEQGNQAGFSAHCESVGQVAFANHHFRHHFIS